MDIAFTFTRPQINFCVAPRQIHFQVGYACMNINTEIPGIGPGQVGKALVVDENGQPVWGAEILHEEQAIDGGDW